MPIIRIDFDGDKITKDQIVVLAQAIRQVVSAATAIEDVFVYANDSQIKIKVAPVEIFVEMSASKISDQDQLVAEIKSGLLAWKRKNNFTYPINLTLVPMQWKVEIDI